MKRNGHTIFEVVQQVVRNFFNEEDEEAKKEFQRLMREPGLLTDASGLEDKEQLVSWLKEPPRFSSKEGYKKFQTYVKRGRKVRMLWRMRVAASFLLVLALGGAAYWLNVHWEKRNHVELAEGIQPIMSKGYIMLDDGSRIDLGEDEGEVREADGIKIIRDSVKVVYASADVMPTDKITYNELNVPRGGEYMLVLTDGTKVWVNADSRLKFPVRFKENSREVYLLSGEAYFQVERDVSKPFLVHTSRGCVKVLGTEFNVRDYPEEYRVVTTLVNGSVLFTGKDKKKVVLKPGFQVIADSLTGVSDAREVNLREYVGWRSGLYVFSHLTLEELMRVVERNYDVTVFFANEECKQLVFSGDLQKYETIEHFLKFIETGGDVRFVVKERTITVYKK